MDPTKSADYQMNTSFKDNDGDNCSGVEINNLSDEVFHYGPMDAPVAIHFFGQMLDKMEEKHNNDQTVGLIDPSCINYNQDYQISLPESHQETNGYGKAPELLQNSAYEDVGYTSAADVFQAGVHLFRMHTGHNPYGNADNRDWWYSKMVHGNPMFWKAMEVTTPNIDPEFKDLINGMTDSDPFSRMTIDEIRNHPWVQNNQETDDFTLSCMIEDRRIQSEEQNESFQ